MNQTTDFTKIISTNRLYILGTKFFLHILHIFVKSAFDCNLQIDIYFIGYWS